MSETARLSNCGDLTSFAFGDYVIRFKTPKTLEHYTRIVEWNKGYLVVMAKYKDQEEAQEEYIDLVPILENLYFDPDEFLGPIKKVRIENEAGGTGRSEN